MTSRPDMTIAELIAKLEAASEGSEELDLAMAEIVLVPAGASRLVGSPVDIPMFRYPDGSRGTALQFTRSLDAALSAVPEDHYITLGRGATKWWVDLYRKGNYYDDGLEAWNDESAVWSAAEVATAPLALCIAILRAKEAS